ncbi:MAG: response regulator [Bacteroidetes bacterium]|nr:response regulator [Bacteroidota bacterium]
MIQISIVEDNRELAECLRVIVEAVPDFTCRVFRNAETAIREIDAVNTDVVLMDIQLPGISGIEATSVLKNKFANLQIVMLTISTQTNDVFESFKAGASGYLLKHSPPHEIQDAIKEVLDGGSPMNSSIARMVISSFRSPKIKVDLQELTTREGETLELLSKGYTYKEIADILFVSVNTIRTYIRNIYDKLQVNSKLEAINKMR